MKKKAKARPKKVGCEFVVKSKRPLSAQEEDNLVDTLSNVDDCYLDEVSYDLR